MSKAAVEKRMVAIEKKRIAVYGRVSSEKESQLSAMENQIKWYQKIVEEHPEWEVYEEYFDKGLSGKQTQKRPRFLKMIEDAKHGKFSIIITREVSRFARNILDVFNYTRKLKDLGVEVIFINDDISTFDKHGDARLATMAAYAQGEIEKLSDRIKAGQYIARAEKNVLYGSGNILGYNRVGKTFIIDDEQAETVRMIFDLYIKDNGLKVIAMELTKAGRKNSKGEIKWHESSISRMLGNPMYIGKQYQCQSTVVNVLKGTIKKNDKSEYVLIQGNFEHIISDEVFNKVQELKEKRVRKNPGKKANGIKHSKDVWMKLLECGCGSSYKQYKWRKSEKTGEISKGYVCRHRSTSGNTEYRSEKGLPIDGACDNKTLTGWILELQAKDIIEQIWSFRKDTVITAFELIKENFVYDEDANAGKIKALSSKIKKFKTKLSILLDGYTDGVVLKQDYIVKRDEFSSNIKEAEDELEKIEGGQSLVEKDLKKRLNHIKKTLEQLINFDTEKLDKDIINQLVDKIIVRGDKEFEWLINLSGIETIDLFKTMKTDKVESKSQNTLEVRDKNYTLTFKSTITLDRAKEYRKAYGKYLREDKWEDINYSVYVR